MNIEKYKAFNGLTNDDLIDLIKPVFPKFGKAPLSMCSRGVYGVVLAPQAVKTLNKAHPPKKENRKLPNKLTVRLSDGMYECLKYEAQKRGWSIQKICERLIVDGLERM